MLLFLLIVKGIHLHAISMFRIIQPIFIANQVVTRITFQNILFFLITRCIQNSQCEGTACHHVSQFSTNKTPSQIFGPMILDFIDNFSFDTFLVAPDSHAWPNLLLVVGSRILGSSTLVSRTILAMDRMWQAFKTQMIVVQAKDLFTIPNDLRKPWTKYLIYLTTVTAALDGEYDYLVESNTALNASCDTLREKFDQTSICLL